MMRGLRIPSLPAQPRSVSFSGGVVVGAPGPSLAARVEAILAGTTGFAIDTIDRSTLWQDTAGTVPALVNGDPVARIDTKWGGSPYQWTSASLANQGAVTDDGLLADGIDDNYVGSAGIAGIINNIPGMFVGYRAKFVTMSGTRHMLNLGSETSTVARFSATHGTNTTAVQARRATADAITTATSPGTPLATGVFGTICAQADWAGTGEIYTRLDGTILATATMVGTPGNTPALSSNRTRLFSSLGNAALANVHLRKMVCIPRVVTDGERDTLEAWLAA